MTRRAHWAMSLLAILGLFVALAVNAAPALASHHPRSHHHPKRSCQGIPRPDGYQVWMDRHGDKPNYLTRLVCSAADRSTVLVKMYFIHDDGGPSTLFLRDVELMHRYHHVRFTFLIQRAPAHSVNSELDRLDRRATPGTTWLTCNGACESRQQTR